jgi:hypothetical protein
MCTLVRGIFLVRVHLYDRLVVSWVCSSFARLVNIVLYRNFPGQIMYSEMSADKKRESKNAVRSDIKYSLRPKILFANIDIFRYILVVDTSVLAKSNMGRRE